MVFTAENAIGAVPKPDSLANIALLNPHNKQAKAPPVIALGENASVIINFNVTMRICQQVCRKKFCFCKKPLENIIIV